MGRDRRRYPRVGIELDFTLEASGIRWQGKTVDLSPYGVKVALPGTAIQPAWGTAVQMRLASPDGRPLVSVKGIVWRKEPEGMAVLFVELGRDQLEGLKALVAASLTSASSPGTSWPSAEAG